MANSDKLELYQGFPLISSGGLVRRKVVYFFFDEDGVVDDYVFYTLDQLQPFAESVVFVSNGRLTKDSREGLLARRIQVKERINVGMDAGAYREIITGMSREELGELDELILMNYTIVGPVLPLADMFNFMDAKDIDFWGLTRHHGARFDPWGLTDLGFIPPHLQSHFIAVRQPMLSSEEFFRYWEDLPSTNTYEESVSRHEIVFERHFLERGYRSDVYVNTSDIEDECFYPLFNFPVEMIRDRRCPFFKRKVLVAGPASFLGENDHNSASELFRYLEEHLPDHLSRLVQHLVRSNGPELLAETSSLIRVFDAAAVIPEAENLWRIVLRAENPVILKLAAEKFRMVDLEKYLLLVVPSYLESDAQKYFSGATVVDPSNLSRALSAIKPDYVGVIDLRELEPTYPLTNCSSLIRSLIQNICPNIEFVSAITNYLGESPWFGCVTTFPAIHGPYFEQNWTRELGAITGGQDGAFWIRGTVLEDWELPRPKDACGLAAAKGLATFAAVSPRNIGPLVTSLKHAISEIQESGNGQFQNTRGRLDSLTKSVEYYQTRSELGEFSVVFDFGNGFDPQSRISGKLKVATSGTYLAHFKFPAGAKVARFVPFQEGILAISDLVSHTAGITARPLNSVQIGSAEIFLTGDPQIDLISTDGLRGSVEVSFVNLGVAPIMTHRIWDLNPLLVDAAARAHGFDEHMRLISALQTELERFQKSVSWRITRPLRAAKGALRKIRGAMSNSIDVSTANPELYFQRGSKAGGAEIHEEN